MGIMFYDIKNNNTIMNKDVEKAINFIKSSSWEIIFLKIYIHYYIVNETKN